MKKKITISIEERILDYVKRCAKEENRTVSNLIEWIIAKDEIDQIFYNPNAKKEVDK